MAQATDLALSAHGHFNVSKLQDLILQSRCASHPIRKLLLPRTVIAGEGADASVEFEKLVEIDEFHDDWPTPFNWSEGWTGLYVSTPRIHFRAVTDAPIPYLGRSG